MKVLITGALGFIGTNLRIRLSREPDIQILTFDINNQTGDLVTSLIQADLVVHLAGVNRPKDIDDFYTGNLGLTELIAQTLEEIKGKKSHHLCFKQSSMSLTMIMGKVRELLKKGFKSTLKRLELGSGYSGLPMFLENGVGLITIRQSQPFVIILHMNCPSLSIILLLCSNFCTSTMQ